MAKEILRVWKQQNPLSGIKGLVGDVMQEKSVLLTQQGSEPQHLDGFQGIAALLNPDGVFVPYKLLANGYVCMDAATRQVWMERWTVMSSLFLFS